MGAFIIFCLYQELSRNRIGIVLSYISYSPFLFSILGLESVPRLCANGITLASRLTTVSDLEQDLICSLVIRDILRPSLLDSIRVEDCQNELLIVLLHTDGFT